ncbi:MAG: hypothetical protein F6K50_37265 [Moorea sp. SIO3I7]|uniref:hypothetical protein n=1 Tax=Moorena sp. SIO3I8 TaxID=2607833 RepID=UPI0013C21282|nr:hypothetical protein [Moorena sp. SIO3I8]NEO00877.1 hypothetical protein [Moorena sp. SIO3I7]NEO08463.1 hypothetical protein [Moorena sp. SIO3I8]
MALAYWPRYANGHAIAFNQITYPSPNAKGEQPTNLGLGLLATLREWPRNRVQPSTFNLGLGLLATLREWPRNRVQPSTYPTPNRLGRTTN